MKHALLITATAALLAACSQSDTSDAVTMTEPVQVVDAPVMTDVAETDVSSMDDVMETKTKAVLLYADWCSSCKILDPRLEQVQAMGPIPGVEFVTLDYTDRDAERFYAAARAAGVEEAVRAELDGNIKTGWLLLVDLDDQTVLSKVTRNDDVPAIITQIETALAQS